MGYKFKYHPDNWIGINGAPVSSFLEFMQNHADFPIFEGDFFELCEDGSFEVIVNFNGTFTGIKRNPATYSNLITAINNLEA